MNGYTFRKISEDISDSDEYINQVENQQIQAAGQDRRRSRSIFTQILPPDVELQHCKSAGFFLRPLDTLKVNNQSSDKSNESNIFRRGIKNMQSLKK